MVNMPYLRLSISNFDYVFKFQELVKALYGRIGALSGAHSVCRGG